MPKRVLVIGGTGLTGPYAVKALARLGYEITVFHRGQHEAELPPEIRHVHGDPSAIPEELRAWAPEIVVHMWAMNEANGQTLMRAFRGIARRVVAISSGDVYRAYGRLRGLESGPAEKRPLREDSPLRKTRHPYRMMAKGPDHWMYDYDKIPVEQAVMGDSELAGTILRFPAVYGPGDEYHRFFSWVKRMDDGRPAILVDERFAAWRWTHGYVENMAQAVVLAASDERAAGRIYNVGEERTPTMAERIGTLAHAAGWSGRILALPPERLPAHLRQPADYSHDIVMDSSRIRDELGYRETMPPEEALERTMVWERQHPPAVSPAQFDYAAEEAAA